MEGITRIPWDSEALEMECYELTGEEALAKINGLKGHLTYRADPLAPKQKLIESGFYYCDTLITPYCTPDQLKFYHHPDMGVAPGVSKQDLEDLCKEVFVYDRFHRDPYIDDCKADARYITWLSELQKNGEVLGLYIGERLSGFFAYADEDIRLHALRPSARGQGTAKYLWSLALVRMQAQGCKNFRTSVSAANCAVLNLYKTLGFSFKEPVDIYHKIIQ